MLNQNPRQADFVLGNCPNCQKVVRIPVTAVTSQSKSQVKCPICSSSFEIADILDDSIPSVEVVDEDTNVETLPANLPPEKINAIDTPELFHVSKENYQPKTEKKNGRFVVPELLSKGISKKRKKSRRRSRRSPEEKKMVEKSLAKLKENTQSASLASHADNTTDKESESTSTHRERGTSRRRTSTQGDRKRTSSSDRKRTSSSDRKRTSSSDRKRTSENVVDLNSLKSAKSSLSSLLDGLVGVIKDPGSKIEFLLIGIGALVAIPVIHLVVWWFVGIDPLGLARPTSYVMPFAVPQELRHDNEESTPARSPLLIRPESDQRKNADGSIIKVNDGKLPRPKLDPKSVHAD